MSLNSQQRPIVEESIENTVKAIAGAGTGKTFVLVERYLKFVFEDEIPPDRLLALTFTTKAASEMRKRIVDAVVERGAKETLRDLYAAWIMNFHQFSFRIIKENAASFGIDPDVGVATEVDLSRIRRGLYRRFESGRIDGIPDGYDDDMPEPAKLGSVFDRWMLILTKARSSLWTPETLVDTLRAGDSPRYVRLVQAIVALWREYENELRKRNLIDFSDMIRTTVQGFRENGRLRARYVRKFKHILVDEFQDTSEAQNELLRILSGGEFARVTVVGDDKQSIYRWRDARVQNLREFTSDPKYLRTNYRSSQTILDLAHSVIVADAFFAKHADEIRLDAHRKETGFPVCVFHPADGSPKSFSQEAKALAAWILSLTGGLVKGESPFLHYGNKERLLGFGDIAVLMRSLKSSSGLPEFEKEFRRLSIPYAISGGVGSLEVRVLSLLRSLLSLLIYPDDINALLAVLEEAPFSVPDSALKELFDTDEGRYDADALLSESRCERLSDRRARENCRALRSLLEVLRFRRSRLDLPAFISEALELGPYFFHFFDGGADERLIQSVTKTIFDLVEGLERRNEANLAAFLETLQIAIEKKTIDDTQGAGLPAGRVRIMTIHTAKGLEFPAVAVPGIKNPPNRKGNFHLSRGNGLFVSDGTDWKRGLEDSATFESEREDREQEERCLLYVAITRAKDHLYLSSPFAKGVERGKKTNLFSLVIDSLTKRNLLFDELREAPLLEPRSARPVVGPADETVSRSVVLNGFVDEWESGRKRLSAAEAAGQAGEFSFVSWSGLYTFARCPLMYYYRQVAGMEHLAQAAEDLSFAHGSGAADASYPRKGLAGGVDGKAFGAFVHQFLSEWACGRTGVDKPDQSARELLDDLAVRYGLPAKRKTTVARQAAELIRAFADSPLADRTAVAHVEKPVHVRLDRAVFRGVLDRVDEIGEGYRIIDYKGKGERAEYAFQVQFYAWALSRLGIRKVTEGLLCYLQVPTKVVGVDVTAAALSLVDGCARRLDRAIGSGRFDPAPGEECRTCAFNMICPSAERDR